MRTTEPIQGFRDDTVGPSFQSRYIYVSNAHKSFFFCALLFFWRALSAECRLDRARGRLNHSLPACRRRPVQGRAQRRHGYKAAVGRDPRHAPLMARRVAVYIVNVSAAQ